MDVSKSSKFYLVARPWIESPSTEKIYVVQDGVQKQASILEAIIIRSLLAKEKKTSPTEASSIASLGSIMAKKKSILPIKSSSVTSTDRIPPSTSTGYQQVNESTVSTASETALRRNRRTAIQEEHCYSAPLHRYFTSEEYANRLDEYKNSGEGLRRQLLTSEETTERETSTKWSSSNIRQSLFICGICGQFFTHQDTFNKHSQLCQQKLRREHLKMNQLIKKEGIFACKFCNKKLVSRQTLLQHVWRMHPEEYNNFTRSSELITHKRTYKGECLDRHFDEMLISEGQDYSDFSFGVSDPSTAPKKLFPNNRTSNSDADDDDKQEKLINREDEDKEITRDISFAKVHRRNDTRERAFQCEVCGKRLLTKEILICHIGRKHPEEKPFECPVCFCMFRTRRELIAHKRENNYFGQNNRKNSNKDDRQEEEASRPASRLEHIQELKLLEIDASSLPSSPHQDADDQMPSTTAENASYIPSGCSEVETTGTSNKTAVTKTCTVEQEKPVDSEPFDDEKEIKEEVEDDYVVSERVRPEPSSILQKPIEEYSKLIGFENDRSSDAHEYIKGYDLSQELMNGKMGPEKEKELLQALQRFKKNPSLLPSSSNQAEPDSVRLQREDHALLFEVLYEIRRKNALENAATSSNSSGSSRTKRPRKLHELSGAGGPTTRSRKRRRDDQDI